MSRQQGWKQLQFLSRRGDTDLREGLVWKQVTIHQVSFHLATHISTSYAIPWCDDAFPPAGSVGVSMHREVGIPDEQKRLSGEEKAKSNADLEDKYHVIATVDGGLYTEWCGVLACCQTIVHSTRWADLANFEPGVVIV